MAESLFLVTIGPVQEFIVAARRTRDLWFGSWLLSELSREASQAITAADAGARLIFPAPETITNQSPELANVANKILAAVNIDPQLLGQQVEAAVRAHLAQLMVDAFDKGRIDWSDNAAGRVVAEQQVAELLEIYWAGVPLPPGQYAYARRQIEAVIAARKSTRDFGAAQWAAAVPKSSIDGQRDSVIPESRYPSRNDPERSLRIDKLYQQYRAGPAERLSGVDLLKRHGQPRGQPFFPSTADIAARPLLRRLASQPGAKHAWDDYIRELERIGADLRDEVVQRSHPVIERYDGGLLFESRLGELFDDAPRQRQAAQALAAFLRAVDSPAPQPYYAILQADGDRMGATLDAQVAQADHELLSERLSTFAAQALQIVSGHDGALVYAGGDDVLALLPLDTALDCARKLHAAFAEAVNPTGKQAFVDRDRRSPTLSAGIAICHQIEPLNDALRLARDAEHKAKDVDGKDALAIVLSKRSGADVLVVDKWGQLDERLAEYTACHLADELPDGAAFQLRDLAQRLAVGSDAARIAALGSAAQAEAIRILGRKQRQRGTEKIKDPQRDGLVKRLEPSIASIRGAADELIVARLLAEATRLAAGKE